LPLVRRFFCVGGGRFFFGLGPRVRRGSTSAWLLVSLERPWAAPSFSPRPEFLFLCLSRNALTLMASPKAGRRMQVNRKFHPPRALRTPRPLHSPPHPATVRSRLILVFVLLEDLPVAGSVSVFCEFCLSFVQGFFFTLFGDRQSFRLVFSL